MKKILFLALLIGCDILLAGKDSDNIEKTALLKNPSDDPLEGANPVDPSRFVDPNLSNKKERKKYQEYYEERELMWLKTILELYNSKIIPEEEMAQRFLNERENILNKFKKDLKDNFLKVQKEEILKCLKSKKDAEETSLKEQKRMEKAFLKLLKIHQLDDEDGEEMQFVSLNFFKLVSLDVSKIDALKEDEQEELIQFLNEENKALLESLKKPSIDFSNMRINVARETLNKRIKHLKQDINEEIQYLEDNFFKEENNLALETLKKEPQTLEQGNLKQKFKELFEKKSEKQQIQTLKKELLAKLAENFLQKQDEHENKQEIQTLKKEFLAKIEINSLEKLEIEVRKYAQKFEIEAPEQEKDEKNEQSKIQNAKNRIQELQKLLTLREDPLKELQKELEENIDRKLLQQKQYKKNQEKNKNEEEIQKFQKDLILKEFLKESEENFLKELKIKSENSLKQLVTLQEDVLKLERQIIINEKIKKYLEKTEKDQKNASQKKSEELTQKKSEELKIKLEKLLEQFINLEKKVLKYFIK